MQEFFINMHKMNSENVKILLSTVVHFRFCSTMSKKLGNEFPICVESYKANKQTQKPASEIWTGEKSIHLPSTTNCYSAKGFVLTAPSENRLPSEQKAKFSRRARELSTRAPALTATQKLVTAFVSGARNIPRGARGFYGTKVKVKTTCSVRGWKRRERDKKLSSRDESWPKKQRKEWVGRERRSERARAFCNII